MKLQKVPAMYSNRSTSNHTHGLVSCNRDFILHNPIDEHLNLQQTMSDPATELYHHIKTPSHVHCLFPKALQQTCGLLQNWVNVCMTYSKSARDCHHCHPRVASVYDTFVLPFNLSLWSGCSVFFTHFCRWPFSSELELWVSIFSKMSPFLTSFLLLAMLCEVLIMEFLLVFQHSWDLWPNPLQL